MIGLLGECLKKKLTKFSGRRISKTPQDEQMVLRIPIDTLKLHLILLLLLHFLMEALPKTINGSQLFSNQHLF